MQSFESVMFLAFALIALANLWFIIYAICCIVKDWRDKRARASRIAHMAHGCAIGKVLFIAPLCLVVLGCTSLNRNLYNTETLAVDSVRGGVHTFNTYYQQATNGATPDELSKLNSQRDSIYATTKQFQKAVSAVDSLRLSYATNSANTNLTALQVGLASLTANSSNILWTVQTFLTK